MMNKECESQLDWSAFCYAAGEMSPQETTEFEARLSDDQLAREALARVVELTQTVSAAESQIGDTIPGNIVLPPARHTMYWNIGDWNVRVSWMAIGGLATLLLALLWSGSWGPALKTAHRARQAAGQYELAAAWSQTRDQLSSVKAAGLWPSFSLLHGEGDDDLPGNDALVDAVAVDETPSWMDAAVLGLSGELSDESDGTLGRTERLEN